MKTFTTYSIRLVKEKAARYDIAKKINSPSEVWKIATEILHLHEMSEEVFSIITLSTKNEVTGLFEVSRGTVDSSLVHPREVFKRALLSNASSILLLHNHPSGDPKPSPEDIRVTKRLKDAGELLGIQVLDHVIIGDEYFSLKEKDMM
ncbi:JAB domain-containing protein [Paramaledivibacter caminithermalis]|jgi:DNA repair protein RadC|uniref:DNA repair protein RadC n=1 Tax=Paramaledivibacter caminithermalis (strain DSM 15212 / CIP 107654 / DViRD3) TaxID=1121301 RepID=A0A1M6SAD5_PARC5|nr:JAB domain-containing protein [Paramaledivibacter caminithermalis]SHK41487.1 DNA repair protein RadC [Paramaledivibacter caminithermalis DSM 15212]